MSKNVSVFFFFFLFTFGDLSLLPLLDGREIEVEFRDACRQQQALPRDDAMETLSVRNRFLQERVESLEEQISKEPRSRPSVGGALRIAKARVC